MGYFPLGVVVLQSTTSSRVDFMVSKWGMLRRGVVGCARVGGAQGFGAF